MTLKQDLDQAIAPWALLKSRFYQAWSAGELPKSALAQYANEYGKLIQLLPRGWEALSDPETVEEEIEHAELWDVFANSLDEKAAGQPAPEVDGLIRTADKLFSEPASALGAMYAFEAQQPETAASKLEGLRNFYPIDSSGEEYFKVHAINHHESEKLLARMAELSSIEKATTVEACREMSKALWDALDGIYDASYADNLK